MLAWLSILAHRNGSAKRENLGDKLAKLAPGAPARLAATSALSRRLLVLLFPALYHAYPYVWDAACCLVAAIATMHKCKLWTGCGAGRSTSMPEVACACVRRPAHRWRRW